MSYRATPNPHPTQLSHTASGMTTGPFTHTTAQATTQLSKHCHGQQTFLLSSGQLLCPLSVSNHHSAPLRPSSPSLDYTAYCPAEGANRLSGSTAGRRPQILNISWLYLSEGFTILGSTYSRQAYKQ